MLNKLLTLYIFCFLLSLLSFVQTGCERNPNSEGGTAITIPATSASLSSVENSTPSIVVNQQEPTFTTLPVTNGNMIAFVSDRRQKDNLDIWVINIQTGQLESITSTSSQDWQPLWSPDGQKLAFLSAESREDVYVVIIDFETRVILSKLPMPKVGRFSWANDNQRLWLDIRPGIWQFSISENTLTMYRDRASPMAEAFHDNLIAFGFQRHSDIYTNELLIQNVNGDYFPLVLSGINVHGTSVSSLSWSHTTASLVAVFHPDSQTVSDILAVLFPSEGIFRETAIKKEVESQPMDYCNPSWSAEDEFIAYSVADRYSEVPCLGDIYVTTYNLKEVFHVSDNAVVTQQPWSSDGNKIVFSENAKSPWWGPSRSYGFPGEGSIWVANYDGSDVRLLTDGNWYDGEAVWRP